LWLANDLDSNAINYNTSTGWDTSYENPSNMYGSSYVRSYLVGSTYTTDGLTCNGASVQNETLKTLVETYGDYIATPSQVAYQETESAAAQLEDWSYNNPNDAYGTPSSGSYYTGFDYTSKTNYTSWENDSLWLPSITEAGYSYGSTAYAGMWNLKQSQLSHDTVNYTWLRSGTYDYCIYSYLILPSGDYISRYVGRTYGVRPALHLDLDAVAQNAGVTLKHSIDFSTVQDVNLDYEGYPITVENLKDESWWDDSIFGDSSIMKVQLMDGDTPCTKIMEGGEFKILFTLLDTDNYCWTDGTTEKSVTLTVVNTMNIGGDYLTGSVGGSGQVLGGSDNSSVADGNGVDIVGDTDDTISGGDTAGVDENNGVPDDIAAGDGNTSSVDDSASANDEASLDGALVGDSGLTSDNTGVLIAIVALVVVVLFADMVVVGIKLIKGD
jgi:hypothetical protein